MMRLRLLRMLGVRLDLRNPVWWRGAVRCSWCAEHGFACGGDVHAIAQAAAEGVA